MKYEAEMKALRQSKGYSENQPSRPKGNKYDDHVGWAHPDTSDLETGRQLQARPDVGLSEGLDQER